MARKKATDQQLIDWRIGHHVEAAGKMIADALNRVADEMARGNRLHADEVELRREHLLAVLESKAMSDRAAQRLLGMVPEMPGFVDLRTPHPPDAPDGVRRDGPDWVREVLEGETVTTGKMVHHPDCRAHSSAYPASRCRNSVGGILPETETYRYVQERRPS